MKLAFRILAPLLILTVAGLIAGYFVLNKPEPRTQSKPPQITKVEATRIAPESFQILLESQGTIRPRTTTNLIPEVSGRIVEVSSNFREGGFFDVDEVLLRLDSLDYETAVVVQESAVAEARRVLHEEQIRSDQAIDNWRRLGKSGAPSDSVTRKPQLAEAEAQLKASQARLEQAKRDLERTEIKAPFSGRIMEQNVDVGQFVNSNTQLGRAFSTDVIEVRLPLTNRQLEFVSLPDEFRGESAPPLVGPEVSLSGSLGQNLSHWTGRVVRVDSSIDERSRQLFVVAEVEDPYRRAAGRTGFPLKMGMFVDATVKGNLLENVFVIPRKAVRVGGEVILIDEENRIRRQKVFPIWSEKETVVLPLANGGLSPGDVLCLTPLAYPANGALVAPTIDGVTPEIEQPGRAEDMPFTKGGKGKGGKGKKGKGIESDPQKS